MRCPYFEEVLVAFCRAYPIKKMIPTDRIHGNCVCTCESFHDCSLFQEIMARIEGAQSGSGEGERKG
jgi:hypothetical protein